MYVRLTYLQISADREREATQIYNEQVVPVIKQQKGNIAAMLLHPVNETGEHISLTTWETKEDADTYEKSGTYQQLVGKVKGMLSQPPVLKQYKAD